MPLGFGDGPEAEVDVEVEVGGAAELEDGGVGVPEGDPELPTKMATTAAIAVISVATPVRIPGRVLQKLPFC